MVMDFDKETITPRQAIYMALGTASVCWTKEGVFDDKTATAVAEELGEFLGVDMLSEEDLAEAADDYGYHAKQQAEKDKAVIRNILHWYLSGATEVPDDTPSDEEVQDLLKRMQK